LLKNIENDNDNFETVAIELQELHSKTLESSTFFCVHWCANVSWKNVVCHLRRQSSDDDHRGKTS